MPEYVECVDTVNSYNFHSLGIIYHKIKPELFFGYKRYDKDQIQWIKAVISTPEQG